MKHLAIGYAAVAVGFAYVTVDVLVKEGKNTPGEIAYYAANNGLLWPIASIAMVRKAAELKAAKG